jgi:hypothetical protein
LTPILADFSPFHMLILALSVFRICRLLVEDEILSAPRERFWVKFPPESSKLGYLLTCYWCLSIWVGVVVILWYIFVPWLAIPVAAVFALSAVAALIDHKLNN